MADHVVDNKMVLMRRNWFFLKM